MNLPAQGARLPHMFDLPPERPIYRYGIAALALAAALLVTASGARTERLIPVFTIGVLIVSRSAGRTLPTRANVRPPKCPARRDQRRRGHTERHCGRRPSTRQGSRRR